MAEVSGLFVSFASGKGVCFNRLKVAPQGQLGITCVNEQCGDWAVPEVREFAKFKYHRDCFLCRKGHAAPKPHELASLQAGDVSLVREPCDIFNREWWHSSPQKIDADKISDGYFHVGTKSAAIDNDMRTAMTVGCGESYLYRVLLSGCSGMGCVGTKVDPTTYVETDGGDDLIKLLGLSRNSSRGDVVRRYVNIREDPGSISLIVPTAFVREIAEIEHVSKPFRDREKLRAW